MKQCDIGVFAVLLCLMAMTTGCASITRGTTEAYAVQTNPPGAAVESSSGWRCTTPCSMKVKRRSDFVLTISKPGFEVVTATVTSSIDGTGAAGMAGNVILGGIIGAGIDAGTGAMHSHKPNPLVVEMVALGAVPQVTNVATAATLMPQNLSAGEPETQLRLVDESGRQDCSFVTSVTKGVGGRGDASAHLEKAMGRSLEEVASSGANSYFIVKTGATANGAEVKLEALNCQ